MIGSAQPLASAAGGRSRRSSAPGRRWAGTPRGRAGSATGSSTAFAAGSGAFVVILIALVAIFLIDQAVPSIADDKSNFLFSRDWSVDGDVLHFGVVDLLWVTVIISVLAMVHRGADRGRHRAVHHPVRAEPARRARSPT